MESRPGSRRVVVVGGTGFFGRTGVELLQAEGRRVAVASRRGDAELQIDAEDPASIRAALDPDDIVVDAAGPFQNRSTVLVEGAIEVGFALIDLADSVAFVRRVRALADPIERSRARVYSACSTMSTLSAAAIEASTVSRPTQFRSLLLPAVRRTRARATVDSLLASVGQSIEVFRHGRLEAARGFESSWCLPIDGTLRTGRLFETADALLLPEIWPSLREVVGHVDTNVPGFHRILALAASHEFLRRLLRRGKPLGLSLARLLGGSSSGIGYEIAGAEGEVARLTVSGGSDGHRIALVPSTLVVEELDRTDRWGPGLVRADRHIAAAPLLDRLSRHGFTVEITRKEARSPG